MDILFKEIASTEFYGKIKSKSVTSNIQVFWFVKYPSILWIPA